jgi:CRP-like cAMP-binding protein
VRLAWLLVHLARLSDAVVGDGWLGLPVNLTRDDLALWIGAAPRSVGTVLQDWRSRGVVATTPNRELVIKNMGFLTRMAAIPSDIRAEPAWR